LKGKTAPVVYDYSYLMSDNIGGNGVSTGDIETLIPELEKIRKWLTSGGGPAFIRAIPEGAELNGLRAFASGIPSHYPNLIVAGIGGSSLGARAGTSALKYSKRASPSLNVFFMDNSDPESVHQLLHENDPKESLYCVVSKSGATLETMSQFFIIKDFLLKKLGSGGYQERVMIVTDPDRGFLRSAAGSHGLLSWSVPPGVGGRFTVLTNVGLVPMALNGIDVEMLAEGANWARKMLFETPAAKSLPLLAAATKFILYSKKKKDVIVLMPYSDSLKAFGEWFLQLWAESLGKKKADGSHTGQTACLAIGAVDQHSQLQLYAEGPDNRALFFIMPEHFRRDIIIPSLFRNREEGKILGGKSLAKVFALEKMTTEASLAARGRPSATYAIKEINPFTIGALFYILEVETVVFGKLAGIDPFDQPGVELMKQFCLGALGKEEFAGRKKEFSGIVKRKKEHKI